jgi:hypothetical protein
VKLTRLTIDGPAVSAYVRSKNGPIMADLDRRATRVQTVMRAYVPVRTGYLLSTIRKQRSYVRGSVTVLVGSKKIDYTQYVNYGTRAHEIAARNKKYLRFVTSSGQIVFAKRVQHPGTQPTYFIDRAMIYAAG